MKEAIIIGLALFAMFAAFAGIVITLAGAKRDEAEYDINFTEEFWRWPPF